ncbi:MAG: integrase core domain-containing protein, partial [Conexivisphaera sp.]
SDHESTFYAVEADGRERGLTEFEGFLLREKIRLIVGRVDHPQTNGKMEKFFDTFERNVRNFDTVDEFMGWYNYVRPHGAFEVGRLETPGIIYYRRLPEKGRMALVDPSLLTQMEGGETICR